jgi:hypothetical protein
MMHHAPNHPFLFPTELFYVRMNGSTTSMFGWLMVGGWFVLREKYCWLVADKPNEQAVSHKLTIFLEQAILCNYI